MTSSVTAAIHFIYTCRLQRLESEMNTSDDALQTCIDTWQVKVRDSLTRALLKTVLVVGEAILHQRAMLLPEACEVFLQAHASSEQLDLEVEKGQ